MGFLFDILSAPVLGPFKTAIWLAELVHDQAENELYSPEKIRSQLMELELRLDLGQISEEQYTEVEDLLLERLKIARQRLSERSE